MQVLVERKGLFIIFIILFFLFTGFSIAADTGNTRYISAEDYYTSNNSNWLRLYYQVDLSELYEKKIEALKDAYYTLSNHNYYEIHNQFLEIPCFSGKDIFLYGYEEGDARHSINQYDEVVFSRVKTVQLSENSLSRFNLSLWQGEFYSGDDYYGGDILPVLLGYEYRNVFNIGDEIEAVYIAKPFKLKVAGILNKDSHIIMAGHPLYLDRYIIMPSINCLYPPTSHDEELFQARHYVNKLEGWFEYNNNSELKVFKHTISEVSDTLPGKIGYYAIDKSANTGVIFSNILAIKHAGRWVCIFLAIIVSIICPLFYFRLQVKSMPLLCINIMSGINYNKILLKSIFLFILILIISNISAFVTLMVLKSNFKISILVIDILAVVVLLLLNVLFLKESKLILYMGGSDFAANTKHF